MQLVEMPGPAAPLVVLTPRQEEILGEIKGRTSGEVRLHDRAQIILHAAEGRSNAAIQGEMGISPATARKWRTRWLDAGERLLAAEAGENPDKDLPAAIEKALADAYRCGTPDTFTAEQEVAIVAIACEDPKDSGNPCSHWSAAEVATQAVTREIVPAISTRTVQRYLKAAAIKPHHMRYYKGKARWDDPAFVEAAQATCDAYKDAPTLQEQGTTTASLDEKTAIQAKEVVLPKLPVKPGSVERRGFEYHRHGTLNLIISFSIALGTILWFTISPTRNEKDYAQHVRDTVNTSPLGGWIFVMDQLNTHMSESLACLAAELCGIEADLGEKGKSGVLKSMKTRMAFLADPSHRIRFVYTPKGASWLNQAEIWFSILVRKLLKRESFKSLEELEVRLRSFIDYFNRVLAKPFNWTYTGPPLMADVGTT